MIAKPPLTLAFNLPFHEAIAAAKARGVVLPDVYYGQLQGLARQQAFSIAGIASLDQLQAVNDSLKDFMAKGGSFKAWKKQAAVLDLNLPAHRLDNIWRTNLQGNYLRGHWQQFVENAASRPYLMYDAINDSRVRPSHLAHDGTIRAVGDAFWKTHSPPLGYRCRCNLISLTEEQATARSRPNQDGEGAGLYKTPQLEGGIPAEPDKGWDYNPFEDRLAPLRKSLERFDPKLRAVGDEKLEKAKFLLMVKADNASMPSTIKNLENLPAAMAREEVQTIIASSQFTQFITSHEPGVFPVAIANEAMQKALGTTAQVVRLSSDDRDKQLGKDYETGRDRYDLIQIMIDRGWIVQYRQGAVSLFEMAGVWFHAAIRTTIAKDEMYLKSLRRSTIEQLKRDIKRGKIIQKPKE